LAKPPINHQEKTMKTIALLLLAAFSCAAGATGQANYQPDTDHYPVPPVPPARPASPTLPMPPAPPAPPPLPAIPATAHAACVGKSAGTTLTHVIGHGETMRGTCEVVNGKMRFDLQSYSRHN
jgi:hypothetical protein